MEKHLKTVGKLMGAAVLAAGSLALISCTRSAPMQKASISLVFPSDMRSSGKSVGSLVTTNNDLTHLIINVSGPGISPPVFFSWDSHEGKYLPPASFAVDVPGGNDRLVQVLAVYKVTGTGDEEFYYGDKGAISASGTVNVTVEVAPILASGSTVGEGQIVGRYVDASASGVLTGPTGKIILRYRPPNGRPPMTVHVSEIFGGFFSVFALQGVQFDYVLESGVSLFGGPVDVDSGLDGNPLDAGEGNLDTGATTQVFMPDYYQDHGATLELRNQSYVVMGWFAPPALASTYLAGKAVCYSDTSADNTIFNVFADSGGTTNLYWMSDAYLNFGMDDPEAEDASGLCAPASGQRFVDFFSLAHNSLGDHDGALAFSGPYLRKLGSQSNYRQVLDVGYASNSLHVKWEYLPGAVSSASRQAVDGSDIFWRARATSDGGWDEDYRIDDGIACGSLANFGFQYLASEGVGPSDPTEPAVLAEDVVLTNLPATFDAAFTDGRADVVICPYILSSAGKSYFRSGQSYHSYHGGSQATQFDFLKLAGDSASGFAIANNVCTPFRIRGLDGWLNNVSYDFFYNQSELTAYNDPACINNVTVGSMNMLNWYGDSNMIFIKRTNTGALSEPFDVLDYNAVLSPLTVTLNFDDLASPVEQALVLAPPSIKKYSCYPLSLLIRDTSTPNYMVMGLQESSATFTWPSSAGIHYYDDGSCMGPELSAPVQSSLFTDNSFLSDYLYFKYIGTSTSISLTPTSVSPASPPGGLAGGASIPVSAPGAPRRLSLQLGMSMSSNTCQSFNLQLQDNYGYATPTTSAFNVTMSSSGSGQFFTSSGGSCSCSPGELISSPIAFAIGDTGKALCYKNSSPGTDHVSASGVHGTTNVSTAMDVSLM